MFLVTFITLKKEAEPSRQRQTPHRLSIALAIVASLISGVGLAQESAGGLPPTTASNAVPHGRVEIVHYQTSAGVEKQMHIYLPPGYDPAADKRHPVLYLNHGFGETDSHWTATNPVFGGFANLILDNLLAAGKARPMIIA